MIKVDKTYTDNPFVDNLIYYTKTMALNCTIKDQDEALASETKESLMNGDIYIACVEGTVVYEMFEKIDKEVLSKYIPKSSNLDLYAEDTAALLMHLESLSLYERNRIKASLSKMAQSIYIDHYDTITNYLDNIGDSWATENKELYDKCIDESATYEDLFDIIPKHTTKRIVKQYLNNYDNSKIDDIVESLDSFKEYINTRTDTTINDTLINVSRAMRSIFKDHYNMMVSRGYVSDQYNTYFGEYIYFVEIYNMCLNKTASYKDLYGLLPLEVLTNILNDTIGENIVQQYNLTSNLETLENYFLKYSSNQYVEITNLTNAMTDDYISNYNLFVNFDVYNKCKDELMDYFDLVTYLPKETRKMIINIEIPELTNIEVFADSKKMLNSYLNTLDPDTAKDIKNKITQDMRQYFIANYNELNDYYRTFLGLPPLNSTPDTLLTAYEPDNGQNIQFGDSLISRLDGVTTYPMSHWKEPIYTFDSYDIGILNEYGIFDDYIAECNKSSINFGKYKYLSYLGDSKLDPYTCRKSMNFELIGIPTIDSTEAKDMFTDAYNVNRDYILRTVYSDAYKFESDYYNKFIIVFILLNTIMDVLTKVPEMIINRRVFDSRCVRYLFEANGIPYYSEIPLKYQQAMLKNLNILIKYKSSTRNMVDICNLFGFPDIKVFGYYMLKSRIVDSNTGSYKFAENNRINYNIEALYIKDDTGEYTDYNGIRYSKLVDYRYYSEDKYFDTINVMNDYGVMEEQKVLSNTDGLYIKDLNNTNSYIPFKETDYFTTVKQDIKPAELKFIKVPVDEELTAYKNDNNYIINYDELVAQDEGNTWDGGLEHEYLKQKILDYEFNAVKTKYISVETVTHMTELSFQVSYFYNMLFDNLYNEDSLTVDIPFIQIGHKFRFMDVICYLFALMYLYNGLEDNIMYSPTQMLYIKGYNFNKDTNKIVSDITAFDKSTDIEYDQAENIYRYDESMKNIFDVNKQITESNYDYREAFNNYNIRSFNLEADIDALDKWLSDNYQMSLDDFIVDDTLTIFDHVITLRQFFTLNNSYYQKSIFKDALEPSPWNQIIKWAFGYTLYDKEYYDDITGNTHEFIIDSINGGLKKYIEIINDKSKSIFIAYYDKYVTLDGVKYALYKKYNKTKIESDNDKTKYSYNLDDIDYYIFIQSSDKGSVGYIKLLDGSEYIKNKDNEYVFASDAYFRIVNSDDSDDGDDDNPVDNPDFFYAIDEETREKIMNLYVLDSDNELTKYLGKDSYIPTIEGDIVRKYLKMMRSPVSKLNLKYEQITKDKYFYTDNNGKKILKFAIDYYEYNSSTKLYELKEDNCYIQVIKNGKIEYVLLKDADNYTNAKVQIDDCYVLHDDGHFISMIDTDFYRKMQDGSYEYCPETLYVVSNSRTSYYDPDANPRVYYKKLSDYYNDNNYIVISNVLYVKLPNGEFEKESNLISPNNCYYLNDKMKYSPVVDDLLEFNTINHSVTNDSILVLNDNNDYDLYLLEDNNYMPFSDDSKQYIRDSDESKILVLNNNQTYSSTKVLIVVFNKDINAYTPEEDIPTKYNPEEVDKVWDENDWFYDNPGTGNNSNLGMNGENSWYYIKPGTIPTPEEDEENKEVGSGFYLTAQTYIGDIELEKGTRYYMAFDIETNFTGKIQICNTSDSECNTTSDRVYDVTLGEKQHVAQTFVANEISRPNIQFLIYDFKNYPIKNGDYIVISNIRFVKAYSENNIPQDIPSYDKLQELYKTNEAIYKYLVALMQNCSDYDTYVIYKKLYDSLMISKYNKEAFKLYDGSYAKTYTEFLQTRDAVLYERLMYFRSLDQDTMHKEIADNIVQVTYAVDDCVDTYSYGYLYSYFPAVSANYIQQYISKIINFFKSWKTHLLGINTVYKFDDGFENTIRALEDADYNTKLDNQKSTVHITDCAKINPLDSKNPQGYDYSDLYKDNDFTQYSHEFNDRVVIRDRVRTISKTANQIKFTDNYNNMHLILNNDEIKVNIKNKNILEAQTPSNDIGFKVVKPNELVLQSNEEDADVFAEQTIAQINMLSTDILDWSDSDE